MRERNNAILSRIGEFQTLEIDEKDELSQATIIKLLKIALKNELEAAEVAARWMVTSQEPDIKVALARQAGDEAKHYMLIAGRLKELGESLADYSPLKDGFSPLTNYLITLQHPVERAAAGQFTREALALIKNEQFIKLCELLGDLETAKLYREVIQKDETYHHELGRQILEKYIKNEDDERKALSASQKTLELAEELQKAALLKFGIKNAPGC